MYPILKIYIASVLFLSLASGCSEPSEPTEMFSGLSRKGTEQSELTLGKVLPGHMMSFPSDHNSHTDFAVEWWYVTANLTDQNHQHYALQWTLFRFASDSETTPWSNSQQYMGHVSLRDGQQAWFEEKFARGDVGNAGTTRSPFSAYIDNWQWHSQSEKLFPSTIQLTIGNEVSAQLDLDSDKAFVLHGEKGFSRKHRDTDQASYYYSQPDIQVSGTLTLPGGAVKVSGKAWYDHEWTSQYLSPEAAGWDWFSIHFDDGAKLMLFNMRHQEANDYWSGTLVTSQGEKRHVNEQDIQASVTKLSEVEGRSLPLHWSIKIPKHDIDIQITPMQLNQWNPGIFSYYEGGTVISGSHPGVGFIELTGY